MRKFVLKSVAAVLFGFATIYFAITAIITTTSELPIWAASAACLCLTMCLAFIPFVEGLQPSRRSKVDQQVSNPS